MGGFFSLLLLALATHCPKIRHLGIDYNKLMTEEVGREGRREGGREGGRGGWVVPKNSFQSISFLTHICPSLPLTLI